MKHKRIIAALLSASMLLGMMLMVPLVHAEDSVSLSQTASPETVTMPEGNKNVTFTGKEWTQQVSEQGSGTVRYEAESAPTTGKIMEDEAASDGKYVGDFFVGKSLEFDLKVDQAGRYRLALAVATEQNGGACTITVDGVAYTREFTTTKGWQSYVLLGLALNLSVGPHRVSVVNTRNTWNVDYLEASWIEPQDGYAVAQDKSVTITATNWENASGIFNEPNNVGGTDSTDWFDYTLNVKNPGIYTLSMEVACGNKVGANNGIRVISEGAGYALASVPSTGGWQDYQTVTADVRLPEGQQTLTFRADYEGWNLKSFTLTYKSSLNNIAGVGVSFDAGNTGKSACLIDGLKGDAGGWHPTAENLAAGVRFRQAYKLSRAVIYGADIPGSLVLSDGSVVENVTPTAGGTTVDLNDAKNIYWVKFVASNPADGAYLSELELQGEPIAESPEDCALDAYVAYTQRGFRRMTELLGGIVCTGNKAVFSFDDTVMVKTVVFYGLPASLGNTLEGTLSLADGTKREVSVPITGNARRAEISLDPGLTSELFAFETKSHDVFSFDAASLLGQYGVDPVASYTNVQVKCRWDKNSDKAFAVREDGVLGYVSINGNYDKAATLFSFVPAGGGTYYIENQGKRLVLEGDKVKAVENGTGTWRLVPVDGNANMFAIVKSDNSGCVLHMEHTTGTIETSGAGSDWHSANWVFTPETYAYSFSATRVDDRGCRAISNSGTSITTNYGGTEKTWTLRRDISSKPAFSAANTPILEAVYNRTMEETFENTFDSEKGNGKVFNTGTNWNYVWTRDTAMSVQYSLAWIYPEESKNCALEKVLGLKTDHPVYQQDTGTGGSYPVSTDRIITALSIWEQYLTTGDLDLLREYYTYSENTIKQDLHVAYDPETGLFKGETGGLDHRDKTYPDWMSENSQDSLANIAESKSAIVNIIYCQVYEIMAQSAKLLGYSNEVVAKWEAMKAELVKKVNEHFWDEERGLYISWEYPNYMGAPKAYKYDVISNGYAVMYGIADEAQRQAIMKNYPLVTYGADTVYPQKNGKQGGTIYHNRGVWPGWEATLMIGAGQEGNYQLAQEIWNSCLRGCALTLTNYEVIDFTTGQGVASRNQLWSIAGTLAGYYRILFGMEYTQGGIVFRPYVADWMDGPFELNNYPYRGAKLNICLTGKGDTLTSVKLDGVEMGAKYVLPTTLTGTHDVELVVTDSGKKSEINLSDYNHVTCPDLPQMTYQNGVFTWTEDARYTYKLWDGKTWTVVSGGRYTPDPNVYGVYSLVAVDKDGIVSELSAPITISPTSVKKEAELGVYTSQLFKGTAGYSGWGAVTSNARDAANSGVTVTVNVPKTGTYYFSVGYGNKGLSKDGNNCGIRSIYLDGKDVGTILFPVMEFDWSRSTHITLQLTEGEHTIRVVADNLVNWYDENMNYLQNQDAQTIYLDYFQLDLLEKTSVPVPVTGVELNKNELTLTEGKEATLTATVRPDGANQAVTWKSSDTSVATVDQEGKVTAIKAGSATITVTTVDGEKTATCQVTVNAPAPNAYTITVTQSAGGTISPATATVTEGEDKTFTITANKGYEITDVLVDGVSEGKVESYTFYDVKANHTITASFTKIPVEPKMHTVTLDPNGGSIGEKTIAVEHGKTTVLPTPNHAGSYRFLGWFDKDGKQYTALTAITADVTLIAHWEYTGGIPVNPVNPVKPQKPVEPSKPEGYYDVSVGDWYYDAVSYVSENGLMTGVSNGKFNPDGTVTRAMVWTVLARMDGENTDGGSAWYSKAQAWAMETGVSDGTDPMGSITREQLAAMLYRFEGSPKVSGSLSAYPDANTVSDWAKDAMIWATQEGIINGIGGKLSPKTGATRAQLAAMLMRMDENMQ